jgi:pimeloyl-ACP methyl ester carboxylesterase
MLACVLRVWLVVEVLLWTAVGFWLAARWQWPAIAVPAIVAIALLGWRSIGNALTFAWAWQVGPERPAALRTTFAQRLRAILEEGWTFTRAYCWTQLWPERYGREGPAIEATPSPAAPVLLVHGYACNAGVWRWYAKWLEREGFTVYTVSLEPVFASIDTMSLGLERRIDEIVQASGAKQIAVVCHSMGGLVIRSYLRRRGSARVARLVTLGTPHSGTALAVIAGGTNGAQLRIGSEWLMDAGNRTGLDRIAHGFTAVMSYDDNLVSPHRTATLPTARTIELAGIGHLSMIASRRVFAHVLAALRGP